MNRQDDPEEPFALFLWFYIFDHDVSCGRKLKHFNVFMMQTVFSL